MKILFFYQYFGTPKGSWSTRVYEFTRRWVKEGHEVTVVTAPYEKSDIRATRLIERQDIEGVKLIVLNLPDSNKKLNPQAGIQCHLVFKAFYFLCIKHVL